MPAMPTIDDRASLAAAFTEDTLGLDGDPADNLAGVPVDGGVIDALDAYNQLDADQSDAEKAYELIEGQPPGLLSRNPWRRLRTFAPEAFVLPATLTIGFGEKTDLIDSERYALIWDMQSLEVSSTVEEGATVVHEVKRVKGVSLSLWCTDDLPVTTKITPVGTAESMRQAAAIQNTAKGVHGGQADPNAEKDKGFFGGLVDSVTSMQKTAIVGGVVVLLAAGYFLTRPGVLGNAASVVGAAKGG